MQILLQFIESSSEPELMQWDGRDWPTSVLNNVGSHCCKLLLYIRDKPSDIWNDPAFAPAESCIQNITVQFRIYILKIFTYKICKKKHNFYKPVK